MQAIGSGMNIGMNKILMSFTAVAVNVFGVYFKLQSFIFMPVFGLTNGMIPIVGYNFGARKPKRIRAPSAMPSFCVGHHGGGRAAVPAVPRCIFADV